VARKGGGYRASVETPRSDQTQEVLAITDDLLEQSRSLIETLDAQLAAGDWQPPEAPAA
jgi:hypothetical protein